MSAGRRAAALLLAALVLVGAAGCEPEQGDGGDRKTGRRPWAQGADKPKGEHGAQPAPVQGDPSAHNTQPGEVDLHVDWTSENRKTPGCEWSKNGTTSPCANMRDAVKEGADYIGLWEFETTGKAGDTFFLAAQGNLGVKSIECSIEWKGHYYEGVTNGKRCSITLALP